LERVGVAEGVAPRGPCIADSALHTSRRQWPNSTPSRR